MSNDVLISILDELIKIRSMLERQEQMATRAFAESKKDKENMEILMNKIPGFKEMLKGAGDGK